MSSSRSGRSVIVGVGNTLMGDEGVGVHVVRRLREKDLEPGVEIVEAGTMAPQCLGDFASIHRLVVVDALEADGPPGAVYRIPAPEIPQSKPAMSVHHLSLADALSTWRLQGLDLDCVVVMGVQPADTELGEGLTEALQARLPQICRAVVREASFQAQPTRKGR